jgi:phage shock protein A
MEQRPDDLRGMESAAAKQYLVAHIATLKLTEKKLAELDAELAKWTGRTELARSKGEEALAVQAENEAARIRQDKERVAAEAEELRSQITSMRHQLPGLAAAERTIDPDLLEQELLMAAGRLPGDETAEGERKLDQMEKDQSVNAALAALKAKMEGEKS